LTRKFTQQNNYDISDFSEISFVFDVWSLGSILLEIISGFPLWLSLKARVKSLDNRSIINYGIFGVSGRDNSKILQKQNQIFGSKGGIAQLKSALKKGYDVSGNKLIDNPLFNKLLAGLLEFDPEKRMSPQEIMQSDFLNQEIE
jgi:serine/threonine protein kinase